MILPHPLYRLENPIKKEQILNHLKFVWSTDTLIPNPCPLPISLENSHLPELINNKQNYLVTEKTDGTRYTLLIGTYDILQKNEEKIVKEKYSVLIDRSLNIYEIAIAATSSVYLGTAVDGELILEFEENINQCKIQDNYNNDYDYDFYSLFEKNLTDHELKKKTYEFSMIYQQNHDFCKQEEQIIQPSTIQKKRKKRRLVFYVFDLMQSCGKPPNEIQTKNYVERLNILKNLFTFSGDLISKSFEPFCYQKKFKSYQPFEDYISKLFHESYKKNVSEDFNKIIALGIEPFYLSFFIKQFYRLENFSTLISILSTDKNNQNHNEINNNNDQIQHKQQQPFGNFFILDSDHENENENDIEIENNNDYENNNMNDNDIINDIEKSNFFNSQTIISKGHHAIDGFIFTPIFERVRRGRSKTTFKWKLKHTIDILVCCLFNNQEDINSDFQDVVIQIYALKNQVYIPLSTIDNQSLLSNAVELISEYDMTFQISSNGNVKSLTNCKIKSMKNYTRLLSSEDLELQFNIKNKLFQELVIFFLNQPSSSIQSVIIECETFQIFKNDVEPNLFQWVLNPMKIRKDKNIPNTLDTIEKTYNCITNEIDLFEFVKKLLGF